VLSRHRAPAEGRALVAEITRRIDAIEAEEAALRPGPYRGRKDGERAPSCASKIVDQRPALAEHEALPAALIVDPQTRKERRMREPALPSADRCAHPGAACTEAGGHSRLLELGERPIRGRGVSRILERAAAVGLDEQEQHVDPPKARQQSVALQPRERIVE